jgi:DNA-binding response OmpR family regulator
MYNKRHILIIEDDESILFGLEDILLNQGYLVTTANNGTRGLDLAVSKAYDLIILDLMLPGLDGIEICKAVRKEKLQIPIIMLTARSSEMDKIAGLDYGADDYITKPFSLSELLARIRALIRRAYPAQSLEEFSFGQVMVDFNLMEVNVSNKLVRFTRKEFEILKYLIQHEGEVVHRHDLLNSIWGYDTMPSTRTVDTFILEIRKKIEEQPSRPRHIITATGIGYKFISGNKK